MRSTKSHLDQLTFNIKYPYGHLYWDRCGQTILDIETQFEGWFGASQDNLTGRLEKPERNMITVFNDKSFSITASKLHESNTEIFTEEAQHVWKVIRSNFGLEDYDRIGLRLQYIIPTNSIADAESKLKKSEFNLILPPMLKDSQYDLTTRHIIAIFLSENNIEYRIEQKTVIRTEGVDPSSLPTGRPEAMSKKQREYRLHKMKQLADFSVNPMYAIMLDIDCGLYNQKTINVKEFIVDQLAIVKKDFLPILENL